MLRLLRRTTSALSASQQSPHPSRPRLLSVLYLGRRSLTQHGSWSSGVEDNVHGVPNIPRTPWLSQLIVVLGRRNSIVRAFPVVNPLFFCHAVDALTRVCWSFSSNNSDGKQKSHCSTPTSITPTAFVRSYILGLVSALFARCQTCKALTRQPYLHPPSPPTTPKLAGRDTTSKQK